MGSIFDLMTDGSEGEPVFTGEGLEAILDQAIADRPVAGRPPGFDPSQDGGVSPAPSPDGEVHGAEGGAPESPAPGPPGTPAAAPPAPVPAAPTGETPPVPTDPLLADLTDLERMELTQLRQALRDPERQMGVRRAMLGVETPAPVAVAPAPEAPAPPPALPEEFEEGTAEAQLWHDNQALRTRLDQLAAGQQAQNEQTEQQIMMGAAQRATAAFTSRYSGKLSAEEIAAVAQHAGMQKLPEAFRPVSSSWDEAMEKSLDYVVRSNDVLLGKILGGAPAAAPGTRTPEAQQRGRQLTALSSAASPSGDAPTRSPLQHRPDGRLDEKSRIQLVQEMMNGGNITGSPGEGI